MALAPGTKLGDYELVAPIGAGGMGEVYKARDTKLGRDVAIKVLPDGFADDGERLARFEREAKLLASLNHENIATLYGVGESDSVRFLAMELVEGETLAERLARGAIELADALPLFHQISVALEAAHDKGVVHRDLKPANVIVTEDGKIKVLDFGLAKALVQEPSEEDLSQSPTAAYSGTMAGVIMGTAPYMSPEQARGRKVDQRTDVWAFGCVLFEALSGKKPFEGETVTDTLAAVVRAEPEWDALPAATPASIRRLLRRALTKERTQRLPHMGAARLEIDDDEEATSATAPPTRSLPLVGALLLAVALVTGLVVWRAMRPSAPPLVRVAITAPPGEAFDLDSNQADLAISRDGSRVLFRTARHELFERALNDFEARLLPNLGATARAPFMSPDNQWVGFFVNGELKKVATEGGLSSTICRLDGLLRGASWGPDDTIVFSARSGNGLQRVSTLGGEPELLTIVDGDKGEIAHRWPEYLPGGRAVLFEIDRSGEIESSTIAVVSLETGEVTELLIGGSFPKYVPTTRHLVYAGGGDTLWAVGFDTGRLELTGDPVVVLQNVVTKSTNNANFGIGDNGTLVYMASDGGGAGRSLVWVDRTGEAERLPAEPRPYVSVVLSPDGTRVLTEVRASNVDVWAYDLAREMSMRLTFEATPESFPIWSADGERIVFNADDGLFSKPADGTGVVERLADGGLPFDALRDDGGVLVAQFRTGTRSDIHLVSRGEARGLLQEPFTEWHPVVSPDGRWIAYESDESGRRDIFVRPFPDVAGGKWQVSRAGGRHALWARSGRELFYRSAEGMMAVDIESSDESTFAYGNPTVLFEDHYFRNVRRDYDVSLDGQRFLMIRERTAGDAPRELRVVLNWHEELKRLVPTD